VIAAISLFAVMTVGIVNTMTETNLLSLRVKSRQESVLSGGMAMGLLSRDLRMAYNERMPRSPTLFRSRNLSNGPELVFSHLESPIQELFIRRTGGVQVSRYWLEEDTENQSLRLMRAQAPLFESETIEQAVGQPVATGIVSLEVEFYQIENDQWLREWDSNSAINNGRFPRVVRLAITAVDPALSNDERAQRALRFQTEVIVLNEWENR
jgi:hypothetical protein